MKTIICKKCGQEFDKYPVINGVRQRFHHRKYCTNCVPFGKKLIKKENKEFICKYCGVKFIRKSSQNQKFLFCSRKCSVIFTNKTIVKRKKTKKCRCCSTLIISNLTFCSKCISQGKHLAGNSFISDRTLRECIEKSSSPANKYRRVRLDAYRVSKDREQKCKNCGYSKHVEACHIKAISSFDLDTKVGVINDPSNIVLLCRNCHWELDHGLLVF